METTDAPEQRPDHTGVIRGADEAQARLARYDAAMTLSHEDYLDALHKVMAVADAEHAALTAEVERLRQKYNAALVIFERLGVQDLWAPLVRDASSHVRLLHHVRLRGATVTEFDGSPHVCDKSCRHDQTIHDTVFGRGVIISDCRVLPNGWFLDVVMLGPHTCTDSNPCDTRP